MKFVRFFLFLMLAFLNVQVLLIPGHCNYDISSSSLDVHSMDSDRILGFDSCQQKQLCYYGCPAGGGAAVTYYDVSFNTTLSGRFTERCYPANETQLQANFLTQFSRVDSDGCQSFFSGFKNVLNNASLNSGKNGWYWQDFSESKRLGSWGLTPTEQAIFELWNVTATVYRLLNTFAVFQGVLTSFVAPFVAPCHCSVVLNDTYQSSSMASKKLPNPVAKRFEPQECAHKEGYYKVCHDLGSHPDFLNACVEDLCWGMPLETMKQIIRDTNELHRMQDQSKGPYFFCESVGDPHQRTFRGKPVENHAIGEFHFFKGKNMVVYNRQEHWSPTLTVNTKVAGKVNGIHWVSTNFIDKLIINKKLVSFPNNQVVKLDSDNVSILRSQGNKFTISNGEETCAFTLHKQPHMVIVNIYVHIKYDWHETSGSCHDGMNFDAPHGVILESVDDDLSDPLNYTSYAGNICAVSPQCCCNGYNCSIPCSGSICCAGCPPAPSLPCCCPGFNCSSSPNGTCGGSGEDPCCGTGCPVQPPPTPPPEPCCCAGFNCSSSPNGTCGGSGEYPCCGTGCPVQPPEPCCCAGYNCSNVNNTCGGSGEDPCCGTGCPVPTPPPPYSCCCNGLNCSNVNMTCGGAGELPCCPDYECSLLNPMPPPPVECCCVGYNCTGDICGTNVSNPCCVGCNICTGPFCAERWAANSNQAVLSLLCSVFVFIILFFMQHY
jgi:hypothetical protein